MAVDRKFIDWSEPILPAAADLIIEKYATDTELDLSNLVLVFTGRRASRRMLELLLEKASPQWPAFLPPRMVTFQHFPEMLYPQQRQLADDLTQLLVWKQAMKSVNAAEMKAALPSIPDDDAVPSWFSLCQSLRSQHNELAEDGLEFDEVFATLSQMENHEEADRWKALRRVQSEYLMQMDQLELWDRQVARLVAADQQECSADFDIILIGTVDMSRIVRRMIDQVADRVTVLIHAPESEAEFFDEHGCLVASRWADRRLDIPLDVTKIADDPEGQAAEVVNELREFRGSRRADEIAVGVADESLVPTVMQKLADADVTGRWPVGMQLKHSRPWRLLNGVAEHLASGRGGQPPDFASLSDLVRHPDASRWVDQSVERSAASRNKSLDWLTDLDEYRSNHLQRSPGLMLGSKRRRSTVAAVIESIDDLLRTLCPVDQQRPEKDSSRAAADHASGQKQLPFEGDDAKIVSLTTHQALAARQPLHEWTCGILRLLQAVYRDYDLRPDSPADQAIREFSHAAEAFYESLKRIPDSIVPKCTAHQAIELLLRQLQNEPVAPQANDEAVDMLGWLELAMDDSPVLIVTGFNEGYVPESVTSDVFLPNSLRSRLGLKDNQRRYARDAYALMANLNFREKTVLIAGRRDATGNPLTPSRLWFAADPDSLPERVKRFFEPPAPTTEDAATTGDSSPAIAKPDTPAHAAAAAAHIQKSGFVLPRPDDTLPPPAEIPVTSFREYITCPYRYFLKRELRLREVEDETLELSAAAFGSLIHDVLNAFGESDYAHATTSEAIDQFLLQELAREAQKRFGRNRTATVSVQLRMIEARLSAFAKWQAGTAAEGWRIRHTEEKLTYDDFKDAHGRSVVLAGRVDRIDQHEKTGQWRVLDYKSSEKASKPSETHRKKNGEWTDLQLPLYRLLVRSIGITDSPKLGYVNLPGDLDAMGDRIADWTDADLEDADRVARQVAADIIDLKIDQVAPGDEFRGAEFARICQDTVVDPAIPWLKDWSGRAPVKG